MNNLSILFPQNLYHSYIVEGDIDATILILRKFLEEREDIKKDNPDFLCQIYDAFTIYDCALIKNWHSERGVSGGKKICIIGTKFINYDAERGLLKMIEEPQEGTHFFIIVPNSQILLDTILSRSHVVKIISGENSSTKNAKEFLASSKNIRIEMVSNIIKGRKDDEGSGGLRFEATELVNALEKLFYVKFKADKNNIEIQFVLEELQKARNYLSTPGASVKMILEHIALVL